MNEEETSITVNKIAWIFGEAFNNPANYRKFNLTQDIYTDFQP